MSIGILVNSDSTAKDALMSLSGVVSLLMVDTNCDFPVEGDKLSAKYADQSYAKVFMHGMIGLSGISGLWIFGKR